MHPRFPRGSPTGRGGPGAAPGHRSILEGLGVGSWDQPGLGHGAGSSYLVCGHWSSGRVLEGRCRPRTKGLGGLQVCPETRPVGSRSHDTKLPGRQLQETGGPSAAGQVTGTARLAPAVYTPLPAQCPRPSSPSEAAAEPRSPRRLLRGAAPAHSPQNSSRTAAGRPGRPAFQSE